MTTFGEELRRERELRDVALREISDATKVHLRQLQALEDNRFDQLPGGIFDRGMIRAYCEHIGIDSEAMVTAYLEEVLTQRGEPARRPTLIRGRSDRESTPPPAPAPVSVASGEGKTRIRIAAALALGIAVLVLVAWRLGFFGGAA